MHRAKGLEFDQVIVLTNLQSNAPAQESADQRRLLYVALTRAKRRAGVIMIYSLLGGFLDSQHQTQ